MRIILLPAAIALSLALLVLFHEVTPRGGEAFHIPVTIGVDAITTSNSATAVGTIDTCGAVATGLQGSGPSVSYSANTITDTSKSLATNALPGRSVWVLTSPPQKRIVASNTATSITVTSAFDPVPPAETLYGLGDEATVDVYIRNVHELTTAAVTLLYDPTKVWVTDVQISGMFLGSVPSIFFTHNVLPDIDGGFDIFVSQVGLPVDKSGEGVLARVTLQGVATGTSPLTLSHFPGDEEPGNDILLLGGVSPPMNVLILLAGGSPTAAEIVIGSSCGGGPIDTDGDGVADIEDNCPAWPNADQLLPPWPVPATGDPDCDGFTTTDETTIGTDPDLACGAGAWPPDTLEDQQVDSQDMVALLPGLFRSVGQEGYSARLDIFQPGTIIDSQDLVVILPFMFKSCELPP